MRFMKIIILLYILSIWNLSYAELISILPKQDRVFAIGDVHGDFDILVSILKSAKLIDDKLSWIGGTKTVVQVGDILDRGDQELELINFLKRMEIEARKDGGRFIILNGNHEAKNVNLDFDDVNESSFAPFDVFNTEKNRNKLTQKELNKFEPHTHGRMLAMRPGGELAKFFASHSNVVKIGETVFVHGGVEPKYAKMGIEKLNEDLSKWMNGTGEKFDYFFDDNAPLYSRIYSKDKYFDPIKSCKKLDKALDILGAKRMIVAHSVQTVINSECDKKVWRIDTGMSKAYDGGGQLGLIEIIDDKYVKVHIF